MEWGSRLDRRGPVLDRGRDSSLVRERPLRH